MRIPAAVLFFLSVAFDAYCANPCLDGALAELELTVVDDSGEKVEDAEVDVAFQTSIENANLVKRTSDHTGRLIAAGRTVGTVNVWARKTGYYETHKVLNVRRNPVAVAGKNGRWSDVPIADQLILRKVRNPVKLLRKGDAYSDVRYPVLDAVKGFDLLMFDWCPPYGRGEYDDLQIRTKFWRSPDDWLKVHDRTVVTMTNRVDGFYFADVDDTSAFRYAYKAETNAVYVKELVFEYDRREGAVTTNRGMPKGKYLIFRTRTRTDENGRVVMANYGLIKESFDPFADLDMCSLFNPVSNDPNLEDAEIARRQAKKGEKW